MIPTLALLTLLFCTAAIAATPFAASWANPVNRNLYRLAVCETGGINDGRPLWTHSARGPRGHRYEGALGFLDDTWRTRRHKVRPLPPAHAYDATPAQQYAVGRILVAEFGNYSSWPSCHRKLGLP